MIFSKIFKNKIAKAKWQNKSSIVRIEAINDELDANTIEGKNNLIYILNNDDVELVRRSALLKLNSFADYLLASETNSHNKLKEFAQKQVIKMLLGEHQLKLTTIEKQAFLAQKPKKALLEQWLFVEQDLELFIAIYTKLAKPQLLNSLFNQSANQAIQLFLLEQVNELPKLEKLLKKMQVAEVKTLIEAKIKQLADSAEKPKNARKQIQLMLSKLLAVKDLLDYQMVLAKREEIKQQWQAQQLNFALFAQQEQQAFNDKYQNINQQLDKIFASKAEQYQQGQIAKRLKQQQDAIKIAISVELEQLKEQLVTTVFEDQPIDEKGFIATIEQLLTNVTSSNLSGADKENFIKELKQQQKRLSQLPQIALSISDATQLIAKIVQLALPDSLTEFDQRNTIYQDWLKKWRDVEKQSDGLLPESIKQAHKEICHRWQQGLKPFIAEQQQLFNQTRRKITDLKRLLNTGKYNACFGLFKKTQHQFELLSSSQQHKLQRDFTSIREKMAELSDWEHYIATPRKQELLTAIKLLVEQPCDNPNEQADKVKQYRKQWNLLGHADDEVDQLLNEQFNTFCEQAFAPCRAFYAEQEKIREQNYQQRLLLIDDVNAFAEQFKQQQAEQNLDWKWADNQLTKFNQKWQKAGEIERSKYKELINVYTKALAPAKAAIYDHHVQNAEIKKQVINVAEKIIQALENNELESKQAIQQVKNLQGQWRDIGYAGSRHENKLWSAFRKINDQIFAKRDQDKADFQSSLTAQEHEFQQALAKIKSTFSIEADLPALLAESNKLLTQIKAQQPVIKKAAYEVEQFIAQLKQTITTNKQAEQQQQWQFLFSLLMQMATEQWAEQQLIATDLFQQLSANWQKKLLEVVNARHSQSRETKTLELEILAGIESPAALSQQRMSVQVTMMQEQMTSATKADLSSVFAGWLQLGKLMVGDALLLKRIEPIFVKAKTQIIEPN
jgi:DNA repair protein SbcC/Rad50